MKAIRKYIRHIVLVLPLMAVSAACTDLSENVYDTLLTDNFYNNKDEVLSAVLRPYTHANAWITPSGQDSWWRLSELSADQLAWPVKGQHGQDGGKWLRLHYHTWVTTDDFIWGPWRLMWWGLGLCTDPIENLEKRSIESMGITQAEKDAYIAELKLLRAFSYLKLMDLYGNIPIITKIGEPVSPPTHPRAEVFAFIEQEIKDNIDKAPKLSRAMLGRMTQASGYAMLVELYLNAEVWSGTERWDDCIAAADKLINGEAGAQNGTMALDPNITDGFFTTNDLSKEVIFSIAYEYQVSSFTPSWPSEFYHFNQRYIYGGDRDGNDGVVLVPGVYDTFEDEDLRKSEWLLEGPMYRWDSLQKDPPVQWPVLGGYEYNGQPLVFVDNIRKNKIAEANGTNPDDLPSDMTLGEENSGVRFNKYKLSFQTDTHYNSTDWNVYRLTWIYFAKAEALMRKNGGAATAEAVQLINDCKKRAFDPADWPSFEYTTATLTMDELLAERGREFIFEGFRRSDLIRFGKFTTGTWWDHTATESFRELYPIPENQRTLNVNLEQNTGYPGAK